MTIQSPSTAIIIPSNPNSQNTKPIPITRIKICNASHQIHDTAIQNTLKWHLRLGHPHLLQALHKILTHNKSLPTHPLWSMWINAHSLHHRSSLLSDIYWWLHILLDQHQLLPEEIWSPATLCGLQTPCRKPIKPKNTKSYKVIMEANSLRKNSIAHYNHKESFIRQP